MRKLGGKKESQPPCSSPVKPTIKSGLGGRATRKGKIECAPQRGKNGESKEKKRTRLAELPFLKAASLTSVDEKKSGGEIRAGNPISIVQFSETPVAALDSNLTAARYGMMKKSKAQGGIRLRLRTKKIGHVQLASGFVPHPGGGSHGGGGGDPGAATIITAVTMAAEETKSKGVRQRERI